MNEDRIVASILAAGILAGAQKPVPAGRAVMIFSDLLLALTPSDAPVTDRPSEPAAHSTGSDQRVTWIEP